MLMIDRVRIKNFRSIKNIETKIPKNLLISGPNNSGKTNFLDAININLQRYVNLNKNDFYLGILDEEILIDVMFREVVVGKFADFADSWYDLFGDLIIENDSSDSLSIRFRCKYNSETDSFDNTKTLISDFDDLSEDGSKLPRDFYNCIKVYYFESKRDLSEEVRVKSSPFNKMINSIRTTLDPSTKKIINENLDSINALIMDSFPKLAEIEKKLEEVGNVINSRNDVQVSPLPKTIDDLKESIQVLLNYDSRIELPVSSYGDGTKSWLSILSLSKNIEINEELSNSKMLPYASVVLLEEPEANLHPNAQKKVIDELKKMNSHVIITTHSGEVISEAGLDWLSVMKNTDEGSDLTIVDVSVLSDLESNKIMNQIIETKSSLIFADKVVLVEGITDRLILNMMYEYMNQKKIFDLGISVIRVDGKDNIPTFAKFLDSINKEYFIYVDLDAKIETDLYYLDNGKSTDNLYYTEKDDIDKTVYYAYKMACMEFYWNKYPMNYINILFKENRFDDEILKYLDDNKTSYPYELFEILNKRGAEYIKKNMPQSIKDLFEKLSGGIYGIK